MNGASSRTGDTGKWHSSKKKAKAAASNDVEAPSGRALWNRSVSFGLVQIPVSIITAERPNELALSRILATVLGRRVGSLARISPRP